MFAASSAPITPLRCASPTSLRTADKRTFTVDALNFFSTMAARYSPQPKKTATKKANATTPIKDAQKTAAKKTTTKKEVAA
jgi:hypothetical protein